MGQTLCCMGLLCCRSTYKKAHIPSLPPRIRPTELNLSRLLYSSFLLVGFILSIAFKNGLWGLFYKIGGKYYENACESVLSHLYTSCEGNYVIYRVAASLGVFFFIQIFLSSRLFFVGDKVRLLIQYNGCLLKFLFWIAIYVVMIFIPNYAFYVYAWWARIVSGIFLVFQMLLIIDWALEWQSSWVHKPGILNQEEDDLASQDEDSQGCLSGITFWMWLMLFFSILFFIASVVLFVTEIVLFGSYPSCHLERFLIIFPFLLGLVTTVISIVTRTGLLPASIVFCFAMITQFSALLSEPTKQCFRFGNVSSSSSHYALRLLISALLLAIAAFALLRTTIVTTLSASKLLHFKPTTNDDEENTEDEVSQASEYEDVDSDSSEPELTERQIKKNRHECNEMFWSHIIYFFSSFFLAMIVTNWTVGGTQHIDHVNDPDEWAKTDVSWVSVGIKSASVWIMYIMFAWSCIAPKILSRWRTFEE